MIVNFYRPSSVTLRGSSKKLYDTKKLFASKNLDCVPTVGTLIEYESRVFKVVEVVLNLDNCSCRANVVNV